MGRTRVLRSVGLLFLALLLPAPAGAFAPKEPRHALDALVFVRPELRTPQSPIELDDLREWLGTDALRYSLARYPADSPLSLDPDLLRKRTNDNPVFYVQYAHARTHNVARNAADAGVDRSKFAPELLTHETESALLGALQEFPRVVAFAAEVREPHRVARYLEELAGLYHRWYDNCRITPLGDDPIESVHRTRLWLNDATGQVLRNGLGLLGVSAPERMWPTT